jgi:hypothetical protein
MMTPSARFQRTGDGQGDAAPASGFGFKLATARTGEFVKLGAAIIFGFAPRGTEPAFFFHAVKGGEQRPGLYLEGTFGDLFDAAGDAQAVQLGEGERFQDQHVESALEQVGLI